METIDTSGDARDVHVRLTGLAVARTRDGRLVYAYPDFGSDLIGFLYHDLRVARRSFWRSPRCAACGEDVRDAVPAPMSVTLRVALPRIPAFDYEVTGPAVRCRRCGATNFVGGREFEAAMSDAVIDAFQRAGVHPS